MCITGISFLTFLFSLLTACGTDDAPVKETQPYIDVMTYNIHHANPPSREAGYIDLEAIAATIEKSNAELVALQELDSVTERSGKVFQLQVLAEQLGMHYYYSKAIPYQNGGYGVGILSKYPILEAKTVVLPKLPDFEGEDRVLSLVKVRLPGDKEIYFGSTHFDVTLEENRLLQARETVDVARSLGAPVIIGGDFNATDDRESMAELFAYFKDASTRKAPTIPASRPSRRIDYILFAPPTDFRVLKEEVLTTENYASDHLPLLVRLSY